MMEDPIQQTATTTSQTSSLPETEGITASSSTTSSSTVTATDHQSNDAKISKRKSTMVKVNNLSKQITEGQVYELFSACGIINRIKMEMVIPPNVSHTSCVIEFFTQEDAKQCYKLLNDTRVADRNIAVHWLSANQSKEFKNNRNSLLAPNRPPLDLKPLWTVDANGNPDPNEPLMQTMYSFKSSTDYQLPASMDRFCATRIPDDENIKNKTLFELKQALNQSKARLDLVNLELWNKHAYFMNPTAFVPKELKTNCNAEMCTKGWTKLFEILKAIPECIPAAAHTSKELNTLHLCEAPGSFICCLNHYLKTEVPELNWSWYASSLQPENSNNQESWFYDLKFVRETSEHWLYGEDGTGDILKIRNIEYLWKNVKHPVTLITADGGAKISDDPYDQENIVAPLKFAEVVAAIGALAVGGCFIIKFLTLLEPISTSIMYLLACVFEEIHVTKPVTTKETNSEVYVVCLKFKGISKQHLAKLLQLVGGKFSVKTPFILPSDIPKEFMTDLEQCGKYFAEKQIELIDLRLSLFGNLTREEKAQVINIRKINSPLYLKKIDIKPLKDEDRFTKKALARTASEMTGSDLPKQQQDLTPIGEYERARKRQRTDYPQYPGGGRFYDQNRRFEGGYPSYQHHGRSDYAASGYGGRGGRPPYYQEDNDGYYNNPSNSYGGGYNDSYDYRGGHGYNGGAPGHHDRYSGGGGGRRDDYGMYDQQRSYDNRYEQQEYGGGRGGYSYRGGRQPYGGDNDQTERRF